MPPDSVQGKPAAPRAPIVHERLMAPLAAKSFVVILAALLPLALFGALRAGFWTVPAGSPFGQFLAGEVPLAGARLPDLELLFAAALMASLLIGLSLCDRFFTAPAARLLSFTTELRRRGSGSMPLLPRLPRDELGEIGRQLAYASLEVDRVRGAAGDALEQRSQFLTTVAHQLRTPLSELLWSIGTLRASDMPQADREQLLAAVDETLQRLRITIEHMIAGAGVEEGRFGFVFERIDIAPLIERLIAQLKPLSARRSISLVFEHGAALPVFADAERISLVLFDLIANALNYTPSGGTVTVFLAPRGEELEVSVTDTGIGIAPGERALLFNKFYRSDRARHMRPDGTGLGLYLARAILERHGSDLSIESQEGQGTRVSFYLHSRRENVPG